MEILKFKLSGKTAFFKQPDVNTYLYFSYGQIHKVALLGLLGAVKGYGGYNSASNKLQLKGDARGELPSLPEFYTKLSCLNISVEPLAKGGVFNKKTQVFNNSVGYASREQGGNLIVKEQWLEDVAWNIYILLDNEESKKVAEQIQSGSCMYMPYLGKTDHVADISEVELLKGTEIKGGSTVVINSLVPKTDIEEMQGAIGLKYRYVEKLPARLNSASRMYELENYIYTNAEVKVKNESVYSVNNKYIAFY